jgi:hypothetical protein
MFEIFDVLNGSGCFFPWRIRMRCLNLGMVVDVDVGWDTSGCPFSIRFCAARVCEIAFPDAQMTNIDEFEAHTKQ